MYTREAEKKLGLLNGSACSFAIPVMPSPEGLVELFRRVYEARPRQNPGLDLRSAGPGWDRSDILRSLDMLLARAAVQILDGDLDLMMHFNAVRELHVAIQALDEGRVDPLLQPRRKYKPQSSWHETRVKETLAACASALRAVGLDRQATQRQMLAFLRRPTVARMLAGEKAFRSSRVTTVTLYEWWKKFHGSSLCSALLETEFRVAIERQSRLGVLEAAEAMLRRLFGLDRPAPV